MIMGLSIAKFASRIRPVVPSNWLPDLCKKAGFFYSAEAATLNLEMNESSSIYDIQATALIVTN